SRAPLFTLHRRYRSAIDALHSTVGRATTEVASREVCDADGHLAEVVGGGNSGGTRPQCGSCAALSFARTGIAADAPAGRARKRYRSAAGTAADGPRSDAAAAD